MIGLPSVRAQGRNGSRLQHQARVSSLFCVICRPMKLTLHRCSKKTARRASTSRGGITEDSVRPDQPQRPLWGVTSRPRQAMRSERSHVTGNFSPCFFTEHATRVKLVARNGNSMDKNYYYYDLLSATAGLLSTIRGRMSVSMLHLRAMALN